MPTHNVMSILQESAAIIKRAQAQQKSAQDISLVGGNPSELPGAEHDSPVPASYSTPDAEVSDGMGPESTRSAEGAGDDSPLTRGHALESDEAAPVVVNEVPLVTDNADADPKTAALCNDLLGSIRSYQKKQAERVAAKPAPVAAAKPAAPSADKEAFDLELTQSVLQKIAAIALSYEEGVEFVSNILEKHAGRQAAESVIGLLVEQDQAAQKQAQASVGQAARDASKSVTKRNLSPEEAANLKSNLTDSILKLTKKPQTRAQSLLSKYGPAAAGGLVGGAAGAAMASRVKSKPKKDDDKKEASDLASARAELDYLYKLGQDMADAATADIMGVLPAEGAVAEPAAAAEAEPSVEDVAAALDALVAEGTIQPEEAEAVMQEVVGSVSGEAEAPAPAAEAPVAEEPSKSAAAGFRYLRKVAQAIEAADAAAAPAAAPEAGEGEEASIEDVAAALDILVSEGTIQPEEAESVLQELVSGNDTDIGAEAGVAEAPQA